MFRCLILVMAQALLALALGLAARLGGISALGGLIEPAGRVLMLALSAMSGMATGAVFTAAASAIPTERRTAQRTAGLLDASDHLGAAIGALLAPLLIIPALGLSAGLITAACAAVIGAALVSSTGPAPMRRIRSDHQR